jgi:hypothetical protein
MIKAIYEPRKRIVIHEYSQYDSVEAFVRSAFAGAPPGFVGTVQWIEGIAFTFSAMPQTDSVAKELMKGTRHWDHVSFASMPQYVPRLSFTNPDITCIVTDVSVNKVFKPVALLIKRKLMQKSPLKG